MNELFEVPNLDGMNRQELHELERVFRALAAYSRLIGTAMFYRQNGNIQEALGHEKLAQEVYASLPAWARW